MSAAKRERSDPAVYQKHYDTFTQEGLPKDAAGWVKRAQQVAAILAEDGAKRDIENKSPRAEIALLKSAGLLKVLGPAKYGGGGQPWSVGYQVIREVAKGDGSIGMLTGYHLLWSTTANVVGTDEQKDHIQRVIIENNYFIGGAVNPRDNDLKITNDGDYIVFNGFKNFNTGGVISDLTVLEGVYEDTDHHIFTFAKTEQPGIIFSHNWDSLGMRLTESGSVKIENIRVPWTDALGWDPVKKEPNQAVLGIPFATLLLPTIQLNFANMYLGTAQGALVAGSAYTRTSTRAWPYGGDNKSAATEEFYILERYGSFTAHLAAAEALCDRAGQAIDKIYSDAAAAAASANGHSQNGANGSSGHPVAAGRATITAQRRGEVAALVAHAKVVTTDTGLTVTSGIYELLGSRATAKKYGFDRFWRDIRTHSLHDPVAYKRREVGVFQVLDQIPEPTWYT